jgi:hypothetical protein
LRNVRNSVGNCNHPLNKNVGDMSEVPGEALIDVVEGEYMKQNATHYQDVYENEYA